MARVVSLWLPDWPTDRLRRQCAAPDEGPFVIRTHNGRRLVIAAANSDARALGLYSGMPLTEAKALVPDLSVVDARPVDDGAALKELARWCLHYAPLTAPDPPDGVWIDATGCTHLFGGEAAMLADMIARLSRAGFCARAAIADTPGAAHALARFSAEVATVAPSGGVANLLAPLPVAALRLSPETVAALRNLGLERIGALMAIPRGPLAHRFHDALPLRLDQALGHAAEPIAPVPPQSLIQHRIGFVEPLLTLEAFAISINRLCDVVCMALEQAGQGARRLDLLFERVDGVVQAIRIGTAGPSRDARHLAKLLIGRLETVNPGLGVEAMRLVVSLAEAFGRAQMDGRFDGADAEETDMAPLIDRLRNRFGARRIYQIGSAESDMPERSVRRVFEAVRRESGSSWPADLPRPARLLAQPQRIQALSVLPDRPPASFVWRRMRHRIRRADGPERIAGEWWRSDREVASTRDYWAVEDEQGRRFWLYRNGDGTDPTTGDLSWYLHGLF